MIINDTQKEHLSDHFDALQKVAGEACWMVGDGEFKYEDIKFKYDEAARLMETLRGMLSAVENNNDSMG